MANERIFAAINTKIRVLKSRLFHKEDYINLINKSSVKERVIHLKEETKYYEELTKVEELNNIQMVEIALENYLINEFNKIMKFFTDDYRKLFRTLMLRYEIEDLKLYLRGLERKENLTKIYKMSLLKEKYYSFDPQRLRNSNNLEEFIENLKGTIYYNILSPYRNQIDTKTTFYLEMNLDRLYFNLLKSQSKYLRKEDRILFEEILGKNEDLLNIEWIYRGIKFYNLLPEELINYTLPHGYEFNYQRLKHLCYLNENKLKEAIISTKYDFLFDTEKDVDLYMERRIERYLYYGFLKVYKKAKLDITVSMAYIHLLEYEISDIISILEAKRYGLTFEETKDYLVRKIEGSDD